MKSVLYICGMHFSNNKFNKCMYEQYNYIDSLDSQCIKLKSVCPGISLRLATPLNLRSFSTIYMSSCEFSCTNFLLLIDHLQKPQKLLSVKIFAYTVFILNTLWKTLKYSFQILSLKVPDLRINLARR